MSSKGGKFTANWDDHKIHNKEMTALLWLGDSVHWIILPYTKRLRV